MTIDTLTKPAAVSAAEAIATAFSHVGEDDTEYRSGGLRDFFLYRDLGIAEATGGQVIAHSPQGEPAAGRPATRPPAPASCTSCSITRPTWNISRS